MARVAARNRALSRGQLLLKNGHSRWGMVKVICCQSQSGRMWLCCDTHCSVALKPQELQAFDLQLWQKKRLWVHPGDEQQKRRTPISVVPQASMRSTLSRVHGVTRSPNFSRNKFQPSSTVKSNFAGRGIYIRWIIVPGVCHRRKYCHTARSRSRSRVRRVCLPSCQWACPTGRKKRA